MTPPRISIVTPSFQQAAFLEYTIVSVIEQRYPNLEYFVMDGGSTDGSPEIIRKYADHITYWQSQPDGGQVQAINMGLARATGEILGFLNSDDFLLPEALDRIVESHARHPRAAAWVGAGYGIGPDGYILQLRRPGRLDTAGLADWLEQWFFQPSCFFSADAFRAAGEMNTAFQYAFDFEFWMRISGIGELQPLDHVLSATRVSHDTKTLRYMGLMLEETMEVQRRFGFPELTEKTRQLIERAQQQPRIGTVAKLMYRTGRSKQRAPDRFVRLPSVSNDL